MMNSGLRSVDYRLKNIQIYVCDTRFGCFFTFWSWYRYLLKFWDFVRILRDKFWDSVKLCIFAA